MKSCTVKENRVDNGILICEVVLHHYCTLLETIKNMLYFQDTSINIAAKHSRGGTREAVNERELSAYH